MTVLAADVIPLDTIDRLPPAVLTGATLLCTLLVAAALPDPVTLLTDIDSGDLAAVDPAEVVMAHSLVDGEVRLAAGPAEFADVEDVTITGAVWSFSEPHAVWATQATAVGALDRVIRMVLFDDPVVVTDAETITIDWDDPIAVRQAT